MLPKAFLNFVISFVAKNTKSINFFCNYLHKCSVFKACQTLLQHKIINCGFLTNQTFTNFSDLALGVWSMKFKILKVIFYKHKPRNWACYLGNGWYMISSHQFLKLGLGWHLWFSWNGAKSLRIKMPSILAWSRLFDHQQPQHI